MIIYPENYDWILAGDVYIASQKEKPGQIQTICVNDDLKVVGIGPNSINAQDRITIIGHGSPGKYLSKTPNDFVNMLKNLGLKQEYSGTIEFFTCDAALFNENPVDHSLAHLTKNEFPNAKVIAAKGPSIYKGKDQRYVVNPDMISKAWDIQESLIVDKSIPTGNLSIIEKGKIIRERASVKKFYERFIQELSGVNGMLINEVVILD